MTQSLDDIPPNLSNDEIFARLRVILAPQGIITVTTGGDEIGQFLEKRFGSHDLKVVLERWKEELHQILSAKVVLIGVPMDCGAGFERGSFKGPLGIRTRLLADNFYSIMAQHGVVDVGDVYVNPGLIDDSYYVESIKESVRDARRQRLQTLDPEAYKIAQTWDFPVSPHSIYLHGLQLIRKLNPDIKFAAFGGDHSTSRIPSLFLTSNLYQDAGPLGILHFDAHTDLLDRRDGTPYNFATWAYHANDFIGRNKRLVQVGVRVSGRSAQEWETTLDLTQIRVQDLPPDQPLHPLGSRIVETLKKSGATRIFISNDIDGTDPSYAAATGTMERDGLFPQLVQGLIATVGEHFDVVAGDIVEVAPPLNWHIPGEPARTLQTACAYYVDLLSAMLKVKLDNPFLPIDPAPPLAIARKSYY